MKTDFAASFIGKLIAIIILLPIVAVFLMLVWSWVIPDVFAGMVENHFLPASITLEQAFKLMTLVSLLGFGIGLGSIFGSRSK